MTSGVSYLDKKKLKKKTKIIFKKINRILTEIIRLFEEIKLMIG
jgi:hypothetical protein